MANLQHRRKNTLAISALFTFLVTTGNPAEASGIPREIIGNWVAQSGGLVMEIRPDGSITVGPNSGTVVVRGDRLTIHDPKAGQSLTFRFRIEGNILSMSNPSIGFNARFVRRGPSNVGGGRANPRGAGFGAGWGVPGPGARGDDGTGGNENEANREGAQSPSSGNDWGIGQRPSDQRLHRETAPNRQLGSKISRSQALGILGQSKSYRLFTISTRIPKTWDSLAIKQSDPDGILVFGHPVPGLRRGGHPFTLPVVVGPYLPMTTGNPRMQAAALVDWMIAAAAVKVADHEGLNGRSFQWNRPKIQRTQGPKGRPILSAILGGGQGRGKIILVGIMVIDRAGRAALFATGMATSARMGRLSDRGRKLVLAAFRDVIGKLQAVAALTDIRPGHRDRNLERRLWRRGHFMYSSRSSYFNSGTSFGGSYETSSSFLVRFLPQRHCIVQSSAAGRVGYVNNDTGDSRATATGGHGPQGGPARCEVRRGIKGKRWLVVYHPAALGGTGFHLIEKRGSKKCGDRVFHGLAIDGYVEGEYVDVNGNCTRKVR